MKASDEIYNELTCLVDKWLREADEAPHFAKWCGIPLRKCAEELTKVIGTEVKKHEKKGEN